MPRICSLLPSATELVCALGLQKSLVGVTHECDYPPEVQQLPVVTSNLLPDESDSRRIDQLVTQSVHQHLSLYRLDRAKLEEMDPDLILTQELCDVCAVAYDTVQAAARVLSGTRRVLSLEPLTLADVLHQLEIIGQETDTVDRARTVRLELERRMEVVGQQVVNAGNPPPRVYCMEWLDPPWAAGHWVPEMVQVAGGNEVFGLKGRLSRRVTWEEVALAAPDVIMFAPCGYDLEVTVDQFRRMELPAQWHEFAAVRNGQLYAVNGSAYFNRPGPRVVDGVEILAEILHPDVFPPRREGVDWQRAVSTS